MGSQLIITRGDLFYNQVKHSFWSHTLTHNTHYGFRLECSLCLFFFNKTLATISCIDYPWAGFDLQVQICNREHDGRPAAAQRKPEDRLWISSWSVTANPHGRSRVTTKGCTLIPVAWNALCCAGHRWCWLSSPDLYHVTWDLGIRSLVTAYKASIFSYHILL